MTQIRTKRGTEILPPQGELYRCFQESELVAEIVPLPLESVSVHIIEFREHLERIRELHLAALARLRILENREDFRLDDISAENSEVARRLCERRFLNHIRDSQQFLLPAIDRLSRHNAVG